MFRIFTIWIVTNYVVSFVFEPGAYKVELVQTVNKQYIHTDTYTHTDIHIYKYK
jgi:hypothetical protein